MSNKTKQHRWKSIITLITLLALVVTAYAIRGQMVETVRRLSQANPWPVALIIPLAIVNHFFQGKLYQGVFRILGDRFRTKAMMRLSLEMNFVNNIFPSAGVSGFSYLTIRMKPEGIGAGKATLVQIMRFALLFVSFQLLLGLGLLLLAFVGSVNNFVMLVAGSLATLLLVGTLVVVFIISSKERINVFFTGLTKFANRIIHLVRPRQPEAISIHRVERVFTELHENYKLLRRHIVDLRKPLWFALAANLTEITAIFFVFVAFGQWVNPGAIIIAYAVANFAGIVSVLPGGIGIYEALMAGVFATAGVAPGVSLPVIIAFRVVSMSCQIPVGYFFYQRSLQRHSLDPLT
jgi:uncharacterized protein (TIRG00374 family)